MDVDQSLTIRDTSGSKAHVSIEALSIGGGRLQVTDPQGKIVADLTAALGVSVLTLGGNGFNGQINVTSASGKPSLVLNGRDGDIVLNREDGQQAIRLSGPLGDVILSGADAAEDFEIAETDADAPAGTVMVIDDEGGRLRQSTTAYDRRVAGVISGAGEYRPGVILGRLPGQQRNRPIALVGRTYCRVDATLAPIAVGDLLTSASTPGHAMKATDSNRAQGAVLGKALARISTGFGQVPILVALQ